MGRLRLLDGFLHVVRVGVFLLSRHDDSADDRHAHMNGNQLEAARPAVRCPPSARFDLAVKARAAKRAPEADFAVLETITKPTGGSPACRAW